MDELLKLEQPLQIVGVVNAVGALLAKKAGFKCIYLSGAGVSNAQYGLPDLGMTSMDNVVEEVRRIRSVVDLPLLVDADTGWGGPLNIARTVKELSMAGASSIHIEDQTWPKRCGHRDGKSVVSIDEMVERINAANSTRNNINKNFKIMARTDSLAVENMESAINRANHYIKAGADYIFFEAATSISEYKEFCSKVKVPVLANVTEFGKTPLYSASELKDAGIKMALYPLSAFRAMNKAALDVYNTIRQDGTQKDTLKNMQTREELYDLLNYYEYEKNT